MDDFKDSIKDRAYKISRLCSKKEIEYITYHAPIYRNQGQSLLDERSYERANASLLAVLKEAEMVHAECSLTDKVVIVYHLPSVIGFEEISYLDKELKFKILEGAERMLIDFNEKNMSYFECFAKLTVENVFPKFFRNGLNYSTINMFHPSEIIRLNRFGIGITFDFSHYSIYSNYLSSRTGNEVVNLDRQIYGDVAPSWNQCIDLFGDSLTQLHINDSKGFDTSGEGLMLGRGDIPIIPVLQHIHQKTEKTLRIVRGTVELVNGHLDHNILQRNAMEWLLTEAIDIFR
jgi:hypothetical protein